jgi:hypothetical protein
MIKNTLLRSAGIGAVLSLGMGFAAHAADQKAEDCVKKCAPVAHHHKKKAPAAPVVNPLVGEVAALKAEVAALEQRLDASNAAAQQAQASAAQAQASAQAAQAAAQNDQLAINQIPGAVDAAVGKLPKPKPGWESSTKVSGTVFYNTSNIDQKTSGNRVAPSGTGFDIKRTYLSVDHKFNDIWSANITTDAQYSSAVGATEFFIKKAYVQGDFSPMLTLRLGSADLPWVPFAEGVYGYRYVENTLIDRTKFGTSADWGAHALGKFFDGHVNYAVSVINGAGYKVPGAPGTGTQGRGDSVDVEGRISVNYGPWVAGIGGYEGKLGKDPVGATNVHHTAERFNALVAYTTPKARVGFEYFSTTNWAVTNVAADKSEGYSGFASYNFTPKIGVFGRYDWVKPNGDSAPTKEDNYFNLGLQYEATKTLDFSLVYKRDKVDNGNFATSNGTIGGATATTNGTYDEVGLFGQIKW